MSTQAVGTYKLNSFWESGRLIFYEKAFGHTTTGDVFILGHDYVQVGDTANDVNFVWDGLTTGTFTLDAEAHTLAMTGVATSTDGAVTITSTASAAALTVNSIWSTAAATGRPLAANLTTNVSLGSYANAFKANVDCQSVGGATGLLSAGNFEVTFPTTGIAGTTVGVEIEMTYGATCGALQKPAFFYLGTNGTARSDFDTYGDFLILSSNLTAGTGKMVGAGTSTFRIGTGALGATKRYIPLSTAGDSFTSAYPVVLSYAGVALELTGGAKATITSTGDYTSPPFVVTRTFVTSDFDQTYHAAARVNLDLTNDVPSGKYASALNVRIIGASDVASTGQLYGLWVDSAGTGAAAGGEFYMGRFSVQSGASIPTAYMEFQSADPGVTYLFAFSSANAPCVAGGTGTTYTIAVRTPDNAVGYIRVFAAA